MFSTELIVWLSHKVEDSDEEEGGKTEEAPKWRTYCGCLVLKDTEEAANFRWCASLGCWTHPAANVSSAFEIAKCAHE